MSKKIRCHYVTDREKYVDVAPEELSFRPSIYGVIIQGGKILLTP